MRLKGAGVVIAALLAGVGVTNTASAGTAAIVSDRDNTLIENDSGARSNGAGEHLFAGMTNNDEIRRGLIHFDIASAVPAGSIIEIISLTMYASRGNTPNTVSMHRVLNDWGEGDSSGFGGEGGGGNAAPGDATWLHTFFDDSFWDNPGGDFESTASAAALIAGIGPATWSSTASLIGDVQLWLDDPGANYGWALLGDESTAGTAIRFDTRENSSAANRPMLMVEYTSVPVPGTLALLGLGVFGSRVRRRKR